MIVFPTSCLHLVGSTGLQTITSCLQLMTALQRLFGYRDGTEDMQTSKSSEGTYLVSLESTPSKALYWANSVSDRVFALPVPPASVLNRVAKSVKRAFKTVADSNVKVSFTPWCSGLHQLCQFWCASSPLAEVHAGRQEAMPMSM